MRAALIGTLSAFSLVSGLSGLIFTPAAAMTQETLVRGSCNRFMGGTPGAGTEGWGTCQRDADCAMTTNVCGFPHAVNGAHLQDQAEYNRCMGPVVSCAQVMPDNQPRRAACIEGRCQPVVTGSPTGGAVLQPAPSAQPVPAVPVPAQPVPVGPATTNGLPPLDALPPQPEIEPELQARLDEQKALALQARQTAERLERMRQLRLRLVNSSRLTAIEKDALERELAALQSEHDAYTAQLAHRRPPVSRPVAPAEQSPFASTGIDFNQPQPQRSASEILATIQSGMDREAARTALDWFEAMFSGDTSTIRRLASDPIFLDSRSLTLDQMVARIAKCGDCMKPKRAQLSIMSIVAVPSVDPVTGQPQVSRGTEFLDLGPNDRNVMFMVGQINPDGTVQAMEGIQFYIRYVPEGIYRVAGFWD